MFHNHAIRDALQKTSDGRALVHEAKRAEIGARVKALKNLAYAVFMGEQIPKIADKRGRFIHKRPDVFFNAKENIRELGQQGGRDYDAAVTALKFAYNDFYTYGYLNKNPGQGTYNDAIACILPPVLDEKAEAAAAVAEAEVEVNDEIMAEIAAEVQATEELAMDVESSDGQSRHEEGWLGPVMPQ